MGSGIEQSGATLCHTVRWRGGIVLNRPVVHDFELVVAVEPGADEDPARRFLVSAGRRIAEAIGHRMLWHPGDRPALGCPVLWPPQVFGPRLELLEWHERPTLPALAQWVAGALREELAEIDETARLAAVELRDGLGSAAVTR